MALYSRRDHFRQRAAAGVRARKIARLRQPPASALIDMVLEHADLRDDLGGGRVLLRLSPERLHDFVGQPGADRLGALAVIWDEREDALFRVLDGAPPALAAVAETPTAASQREPEDEPAFELTEAALAYLAAHVQAAE